jgi:hypothetical protein
MCTRAPPLPHARLRCAPRPGLSCAKMGRGRRWPSITIRWLSVDPCWTKMGTSPGRGTLAPAFQFSLRFSHALQRCPAPRRDPATRGYWPASDLAREGKPGTWHRLEPLASVRAHRWVDVPPSSGLTAVPCGDLIPSGATRRAVARVLPRANRSLPDSGSMSTCTTVRSPLTSEIPTAASTGYCGGSSPGSRPRRIHSTVARWAPNPRVRVSALVLTKNSPSTMSPHQSGEIECTPMATCLHPVQQHRPTARLLVLCARLLLARRQWRSRDNTPRLVPIILDSISF